MRGWRGAVLLLCVFACTTPLEEGERHYRAGDRLAALEAWREVAASDASYERAQQRIAEVSQEFERLVLRYKQRGRYFEERERLAESILNYRLALKLQPDDRETLERTQALSRRLASEKADSLEGLRSALGSRDLPAARETLGELRRLDPFDPGLERDERHFRGALSEAMRERLESGRARFAVGDLGGAEAAFREASTLDPEDESAQGYLAYVRAVRAAGGAAAVGRLEAPPIPASQDEIRAEGFYQRALAAERRGDPYAAIRHDLAALDAEGEHEAARRHLALLRGRLAPRVEGLIESGRAHYLEEDLESALDEWRRALLIDPSNERASEYAERAHRLLENLERLRSEPGGAR